MTNPLSLNLYTYCINNPLIYVDPSGHAPKSSAAEWLEQASERQAEYSGGIVYKIQKNLQKIVSKSPLAGIIEGVKGETLISKKKLSDEQREQSIEIALDKIINSMIMLGTEGTGEAAESIGRGYHKEVYGNRPVKVEEAVDKWDEFLGPKPYNNVHPRTGQLDADRIFSQDSIRSIRFGNHEMNSKPTKFHYHEEIWTYDPINNVMNVDNTVIRVPYKK